MSSLVQSSSTGSLFGGGSRSAQQGQQGQQGSCYAVWGGLRTGIFDAWGEAEKHVKGIPGATCKKFSNRAAAEEHLQSQGLRALASPEEPRAALGQPGATTSGPGHKGAASSSPGPGLQGLLGATSTTSAASSGSFGPGRRYLDVPFKEKEKAKNLGAKWDPEMRKWYVPPGGSLTDFAKWLVDDAAGDVLSKAPQKQKRTTPPMVNRLSADAAGGVAPQKGAASTMFKSPVERKAAAAIELDELALYTDGACKGNNNVKTKSCPAGWGVVVIEGTTDPQNSTGPGGVHVSIHSRGKPVLELFGPVIVDAKEAGYLGAEVCSNNTGELSGICEALLWLRDHETTGRSAAIYYDSEYAAKITMKAYRAQKNVRLAEESQALYVEVRKQRKVRFCHVKGHAGHRWNDAADAAANKGATGACCKVGRWAPGGSAGGADAAAGPPPAKCARKV